MRSTSRGSSISISTSVSFHFDLLMPFSFFFHFSLSFHFHSILISFYLVFVQVDTMDISAGVLVREGKLIRRGPRQVERTVNYGTLKLIYFISQAKTSLSRLALSHLLSRLARSLLCSFVFPTILCISIVFSSSWD